MTLDDMCKMAARLSDRFDEFEKTEDDNDAMVYQDDALHYFNVFTDAINEAYFEVSRHLSIPDTYQEATIPSERKLDLTDIDPELYTIKNVLTADRSAALPFIFYTRTIIELLGGQPGDPILLYYHHMPARLTEFDDAPVFSESAVDPLVYVALAVARIWQSEKKIANYNMWMGEYYQKLRSIKPFGAHDGRARRLPRPVFR